jgi:hypothetical protein
LSQTGILAAGVTTSLGSHVFCGSNLSSIDFSGTSLTSLGYGAFYYSTSLHEVKMISSINTLGAYAFAENYSLSSFALTDITNIGTNSFYNCYALDNIDFGSTSQRTLTGINGNSFGNIVKNGKISGTDKTNWLTYLKGSAAGSSFAG